VRPPEAAKFCSTCRAKYIHALGQEVHALVK
jgi:hypothetical protein